MGITTETGRPGSISPMERGTKGTVRKAAKQTKPRAVLDDFRVHGAGIPLAGRTGLMGDGGKRSFLRRFGGMMVHFHEGTP